MPFGISSDPSTHSISLCWLKEHERCNGNVEADKSAKRALNMNIFFYFIPLSIFVALLTKTVTKTLGNSVIKQTAVSLLKEFLWI